MSWQERYREFRDRFKQGLDPRFYNIEYLDWLLFSGRAAIWFSDNAAIVAEIKAFPTGAKAVVGFIAAGDKGEIAGLIPLAEDWGRANGCQFGMIDSREGWSRAMRHDGYALYKTAILKELQDG